MGAEGRKAFVHGIPGHVGEGERYFLNCSRATQARARARTRETASPHAVSGLANGGIALPAAVYG